MAEKSDSQRNARTTKVPPVNAIFSRVGIAVRANTVIFPLDGIQLIRAIVAEGFVPPDLPEGSRVAGFEARKGEVRLRFDAEKMTLGIQAPTPKEALRQFEWLENLAKVQFGFDTFATAHYYELVASMVVKAKRNPLESWTALASDLPAVRPFSELFERQLVPFGMRLFETGKVPNSTEWFELRIEPQLPNVTSQHYLQIILRTQDRQRAIDSCHQLDDAVGRLIELLGRG